MIAKYLYNLSSQGNTKHNKTDFQKSVGEILCEVRSFALKVRREEGRGVLERLGKSGGTQVISESVKILSLRRFLLTIRRQT